MFAELSYKLLMAANEEEIGRRRLPVLIDKIAREDPQRPYVSIPVDDAELSKGFRDITYKQFANGINRAVQWLRESVPTGGPDFETLAYAGPKDLRYPMLAVACLKTRKRLLLCSPYATPVAQRHLLKLSETTTYIHSKELKSAISVVLEGVSGVRQLQAPEWEDWLFGAEVPQVPFKTPYDQCINEPWLIIHTSGTTGLPKILPYTLGMMSSFDILQGRQDSETADMSYIHAFKNKRMFVAIPSLHYVGINSLLQWTVILNAITVLGPLNQPTPQQTVDTLRYSGASTAMMPPALIEAVTKIPAGLSALRSLPGGLFFAGAPLPAHVASQLVEHVHVGPGIGSTEVGAYWTHVRWREPDAWQWYQFRAVNGFEFQPVGGGDGDDDASSGLHEMVVRRRPDLARYQQVFQLFPHLKDEYRTSDLWLPHPDKPGLWKFAGRADDMVKLIHGESLLASEVENIMARCPIVRAALVAGDWKPHPCVVLDLKDSAPADREACRETIRPFFDQANGVLADVVKIPWQNVIFADPARPLPITAKGTVQRRAANELYKNDVDKLYPAE